MRILMLAPGSWIHSKRIVNCLLESSNEITFVDGENPYPEGRAGFKFLTYPRTGSRIYRNLIGRNRATKVAEALITAQFRRLSKRGRPDIVHVCWLDTRAFLCVKAGLKPLVLSVWGSDLNSLFLPNAHPAEVERAKHVLAAADVTVVDAPDMHEKCSAIAGRKVRTRELHMGADTRMFTPNGHVSGELRQKLAIPAGAKVLVSIRAMSAKYGHHVILEAFAQSLKRLNTNAILIFKEYNPNPGEPLYVSELRSLAERLGVDKLIRWMGELPLKQMPELYALSDGIISFPAMDAFPVTFVEAAACERTVIAGKLPSYLGTFAEKYFRMVEPGNIEMLSAAIVKLINEAAPEREERLAQLKELRLLVSRDYDERVFSRRLLDLYQEVADRELGGDE
jgi:glycosyltransferase involved in cell wall biosynthesis